MSLIILAVETRPLIDPTVTAAAFATLISSGVATTVALLINKGNALKSLNDQFDNILKISVQYPYLESPKFCSEWNENKDSDEEKIEEKILRYEMYCTLVFNYLERLCKFYNYNEKKINNHLNMKDWILTHKDCWLNPTIPNENDGYDDRLKKLIFKYIN